MKQSIFVTRRLIIRPFRKSDYAAWFEAYVECGAAQSRWDHGPYPAKKSTPAHFDRFRKRLKTLAKKDDYYRYGVFKKNTGQLVGHIDFDIFLRATHQFANFGYMVHNAHWGRGFGQESAAAGLRIGFKELNLNRLEAAINLDNRKSIRLVKAIGMRREGIKRRYWFEDGKWVDHLIYVANPEDVGLTAKRPFYNSGLFRKNGRCGETLTLAPPSLHTSSREV